MVLFTAVNLLRGSILLFLSAAALALVLLKWQKLCNIVSNIICITASISGITAALIHLLTDGEKIVIAAFKPAIPVLSFDLALDRLSAFFVLGLCVLVLCVSTYSIGYVSHYYGKRNVGLFNFLYSTFILSMFLVITSANAVFFFIAWEAMSMLSYFLVVFEPEKEENQKAGTLYIIMTHVAAAFLLIAFMTMFRYTGSFDLFGNASAIPPAARNVMFLLFLAGFGTKAGVIPVHIWLPYAHPAAPSNISALMSGIMIKTAIYGLIRFVLCYLKVEDTWWGISIVCIGVVSAVLGIAYALMENNIKRLLAFSSIENIGIVLIGLGISFMAFSQNNGFLGSIALAASLLHTFNHMLFKGGLFLGAGSIQYATHTKDIEKLGGLIKKMPVTAFLILCFSLAISAIVPFNGFISEWLTYQSLFMNISAGHAAQNILSILSAAALGIAGALAVYCFVKLFGISFLGLPRSSHASEAEKVPAAMNAGMGMLAAFCLFIGLFPTLFLKVADSVVLGIGGVSIMEKLQGGFVTAWYPLQVSKNSISPLELLIVLAAIIAVSLLVLRLIGGKYAVRKYGTWDCGYEALNPRMQYTATGFSKPIRIVFRALYRTRREVEAGEGQSPYFPSSIKYKVTNESIFENYLYKPLIDMVRNFSRKIKFTIQTGSIHAYLIYIFLAVLILMIYNRLA